MGTLYRIRNNQTDEIVGDLLIDSSDALLLSSTYELVITADLTETLADLKLVYIRDINRKTAQVRARFITLEPGQETTYARKASEALAYIQAVDPVDTDYPYLDNEATATGTTVAALASSVLAKVQEMDDTNVIVEAQRKRGIKKVTEAIDEATSKAERDGAITALDVHGGV